MKKYVDSNELKELLFAKRDGKITDAQNERLGDIATHLANIVLRTPKMRRFLWVSDPNGELDLEAQAKAQIVIVIMGTCPYTYDENEGRAYSYCLSCAHSEACDVIKMYNRRVENKKRIAVAYRTWQKRNLPAQKASCRLQSDYNFAMSIA
ncbi:MAG: hypothetical protein J6T54_12420 [Fibrobacter sp.]|nr:hypothetical protein [Fibrobacter sp.]